MDGVNTSPKDKNYDLFELAVECTSKRLYPNYCNCDWSNDQDLMDKSFKENFINNLSDEKRNKLIKKIEENPELGNILGLEVC